MMETKLARISQLSKQNPNMVFTSVGHLINEEMLIECHRDMDGDKAVGIDGVTKEMYGDNLEANVKALVERLKRKSYKPQPARRVEIPKDNGKTRPLNTYCLISIHVSMAFYQHFFINQMSDRGEHHVWLLFR